MSGAPRVAAAPRLYDRTSELAAVAELAARAAEGKGAVLLLTGGPGTGRTALLDRAVRDSRVRAHRVAAPGGNRVPWSGIRALVSALAPTPSAARRALRAARGPGGVPGALAALCPGEPLLLCLDDHHLWDAHSRTALDAAWRANTGPWAWVVSFAAYHRPPDVPGARLLSLGRLSRDGARNLLDDVCRVPLTASFRTRLLDEAAGHPGVLTATAARVSAEPGGADGPSGPVTDDASLAEVYRGLLDSLPAECGRVLALVAVAGEPRPEPGRPDPAAGGPGALRPVGADAVLAVARAVRASPEALDRLVADGLLRGTREALRFDDPFLRRAVLGTVPPSRRRELHALFDPPAAARSGGRSGPAGGDEAAKGRGAAPARVPHPAGSGAGTSTAPSRSRGASPGSGPAGVPGLPAETGPARDAGHRPDRFRAPGGAGEPTGEARAPEDARGLPGVVRGRAELARGLAGLGDGPVGDAHQVLLLAASLLREGAPEEASEARFLAMEAAWAAGDPEACATALGGGGFGGERPGSFAGADTVERDFRDGMRAALAVRLEEARAPLARVVARDGTSDEPRRLLRAGAAALVLGDAPAAVRVLARALATMRATAGTALLPRVLEHLAYAELRAGQHERAAAHAREGLRTAESTGQRNAAAHQHAVLALAASVRGDAQAVVEHAGRALGTARAHGLVQATTLAEWSIARAELASGLAAQAAARLAPLVGRGPRGGHFALRMLVVPCFVEAACAAGREAEAGTAAEEFAVWAGLGLDPQAPGQLARCRALLAEGGDSADWYREAVRHHEESGNDFERARTLLAYGKWLRRRRRLVEARGPLSDAMVTFERAAAGVWADQARAELRATGGAVGRRAVPGAVGELTPQQQRIARLVAAGATNHEIADRLSLSPRTVDHHLRNVFARLGVRSRVELSGLLSRTTGDGRRSDR
ncbi:LuxR C-terminal-related transcriptional regulator [Streptomyces sp. NK15101]|uniref:helix-turn-helix transcriptional regulator n=1 Tax=Streptomyces sp. NK15101 TaxID=2873261 RepID=UPI001CECA6BA|nr:LuxR C-terminal-related transcriptional regulator [Streptomyces sp. NK15101]